MDNKQNISCAVCGENDFHHKEGYFYCNECGTKSEQVRAVEVERDENQKRRNVLKIKTEKTSNKPQLTSWECYNYILRGAVEELIEMGAKDELKVMVFQLWAAFLRSREVAFFSRRHPELPKLGIRYEKMDANILYNHAIERKKARRIAKEKMNSSNSVTSRRKWRKEMKKFDQSQYEASMSQSMLSQSNLSQSSLGETSFNSSDSAPSNRAIQLKFSSKARKILKKKMPIPHLKKHEEDFNHTLNCHKMNAKVRDLKHSEIICELNMKLVFAIIAVALNLIEDEIQLTDLVRFAAEGQICSNLQKFFPDNISDVCNEILYTYRLHIKSKEFTVANMREQCSSICKMVHVRFLKTPDILKIVERYVTELCLPPEVSTFIERLINLHPPKMTWDSKQVTPNYESRAMAYIIFTLKLLFGIDGRKEKQISRSARRVNAQLSTMNLKNYEELFVWDAWVEYIEMRKIILCNKNLTICRQFKQIPRKELYLQDLTERCKQSKREPLSKTMTEQQTNMGFIFESFLQACSYEEEEVPTFTPSLLPCQSYLKRLRLDPKINATIPDIMNIDHSKRTMLPLLNPKKLVETFANCDKKLKVVRIACTDKQNSVGIFRNPHLANVTRFSHKVRLTDDEKAWDVKIESYKPPPTIFVNEFEKYHRNSLRKIRKREFNEEISVAIKCDIDLNNSYDMFEEDNMETSQYIPAPRRYLENIDIFADVSEDENYEDAGNKSQDESDMNVSQMSTTKLAISNMDYWLLMGKTSELIEIQAKELKGKLQVTFSWLLETCANTIGVDWTELYDELMVLETFFTHAIEPLDEFKNRIIFKPESEVKDINKIVRYYKSCW